MSEKPGSIADLSAHDLVPMSSEEPKAVRLQASEVLFKNGDPGVSMYVVRSGAERRGE